MQVRCGLFCVQNVHAKTKTGQTAQQRKGKIL
nr:MAG TPA_asm: hypothetical protein [Caudoviricetes sp.]